MQCQPGPFQLPDLVSNALPLFPPPPYAPIWSLSSVKFDSCREDEALGFESSDPSFRVRKDGSIYAERDVSGLLEPVQFIVTARSSPDMPVWETTIKLTLAGHSPPPPDAPTVRVSAALANHHLSHIPQHRSENNSVTAPVGCYCTCYAKSDLT